VKVSIKFASPKERNVPKKTLFITRLAILLALTFIFQMAGLPQPITGPVINAMLLITGILLGNLAGMVLGCLTPIMALLHGQLPMPLAPMVPFIAIGNVLLVLVYNYVAQKQTLCLKVFSPFKKMVGVLLAAFAKFLLIYVSIKIFLPILLNVSIPEKISVLMATPQFITATAGGIIALIFTQILAKVS